MPTLPPSLLTTLHERLVTEPRHIPRFPVHTWSRVMASGWAYFSDIEDMALAMDDRLHGMNFRELASALGFPIRVVFSRPRFASSDPAGYDSVATMDVAGLFIVLQRCGFCVLPDSMAEDLRPLLDGRSELTGPEIDVLFHRVRSQRERFALTSTEQTDRMAEYREETVRLGNGYRLTTFLAGELPYRLTICGPKWRAPRARVAVECEVCGSRYETGDRDSVLSHQSWHARVLRVMQPRASKKMREHLQSATNPEMVTEHSPIWLHRELYQRAWAFKREFGYDLMQWNYPKTRAERARSAIGYLFCSSEGVIDGGCAFRRRGNEWSLDWVWIRPEMRRRGLLAARWRQFVERFGDFSIEHPLSDAMTAFVERHGSDAQKTAIATRRSDAERAA